MAPHEWPLLLRCSPLWDDWLYHASALIAWIKYAQTVVLLLRSYVAWCSFVGVTPTAANNFVVVNHSTEEKKEEEEERGGLLVDFLC